MVVDYAELIKRKYHINFKCIKLLENNFSFAKVELRTKYLRFLDPDILLSMFEFVNFIMMFLSKYKNTDWNYFEKNVCLFLCKEFNQIFGLFVNLLVLLYYVGTSIEKENEFKKELQSQLERILEVLENHRLHFDIFLHQNASKFEPLSMFIINRNIQHNCKILFKAIDEINKKQALKRPDILTFVLLYLNFVIKIPYYKKNQNKFNPRNFKFQFQLPEIFQAVENCVQAFSRVPLFSLKILRLLPSAPQIEQNHGFYEAREKELHRIMEMNQQKYIVQVNQM